MNIIYNIILEPPAGVLHIYSHSLHDEVDRKRIARWSDQAQHSAMPRETFFELVQHQTIHLPSIFFGGGKHVKWICPKKLAKLLDLDHHVPASTRRFFFWRKNRDPGAAAEPIMNKLGEVKGANPGEEESFRSRCWSSCSHGWTLPIRFFWYVFFMCFSAGWRWFIHIIYSHKKQPWINGNL